MTRIKTEKIKPIKLVNCIVCDTVIKNKNKKFCSKECYKIHSKPEFDNCIQCNTILFGNKRKRFCNQTCFADYNRNIKIENNTACFYSIKVHLIKTYGEKCSECGWDKKNEYTNKVPIEMDHIDGNSENNNLINLRLLCPNCHSLTKTYKGANKGNGRFSRIKRYHNDKSY